MIYCFQKERKKNDLEFVKNHILYDVIKYQVNDQMHFTSYEILSKLFCICCIKKKKKKKK